MKTPFVTRYTYTQETTDQHYKLLFGTVSEHAHATGMHGAEPLIVIMDCLLRYAQAYQQRHEQPLQNDGVLGDEWLAAAKGIRALLNGDGAIAMIKGITTDSKDNGAVENVFWKAMEAAGYTESEL